MHNRVITAVGNNSESNNFRQHKHSMNNALISSAEAFAAGKKLGMSEEQVLEHLSLKRRRQQTQGANQTENDLRRQLVQSAASLADAPLASPEIQGVGYLEAPEVDPFGQDQGQYATYEPGDAQYDQQEIGRMREFMGDMEDRSEGGRRYDRAGNVVLKSSEDPAEYDGLQGEIDRLNESREREPNAPKSVLQDALGTLQSAKQEQAGLNGLVRRAMGREAIPGLAQVEGDLELQLDPRIERDAERSLAAGLVQEDSSNQNYRRAAYNNIMAQIEAEDIGETLYRPSAVYPQAQLPAVAGDANLDGIRRMGAGAGTGFPLASQQTDMLFPGGDGFGGLGPAVDPLSGTPVGAYGPTYQSPNTDQSATLNAPTTTRSWMVQQQPGYSEGGRSFGNYPQVDVNGATSMFANRLRQQPGFENISQNVRSIDEVDRAVQMAIRNGEMNFATREPVEDARGNVKLKSTPQANPDVRGLMSALRYTPAQEAELANAMYQMEVAKATEINQQGKQQYFTRTGPNGALERTGMGSTVTPGGASVFFDSPEAIDPRDGQANVARVNPGQTLEGRDIKTALGNLESPDAARPFIGAVAETDPSTGRTRLEQNAGPGFYTAYNSTGETDPVAIESNLRAQEQEFAYNRAKTAAKKKRGSIVRPAAQQPIDEAALKEKADKAIMVTERARRDEEKRKQKENTIMEYMPPAMRRGSSAPRGRAY